MSDSLILCEKICTALPRPYGWRWCFQSQNRLSFYKIPNLNGHLNCISGSKVTAILLFFHQLIFPRQPLKVDSKFSLKIWPLYVYVYVWSYIREKIQTLDIAEIEMEDIRKIRITFMFPKHSHRIVNRVLF